VGRPSDAFHGGDSIERLRARRDAALAEAMAAAARAGKWDVVERLIGILENNVATKERGSSRT
jgi:hypothetical protein